MSQLPQYLQSAVSDQVISLEQAIRLQQVLDQPRRTRGASWTRRSGRWRSSYTFTCHPTREENSLTAPAPAGVAVSGRGAS